MFSDDTTYQQIAALLNGNVMPRQLEQIKNRFESGEPKFNRYAFFLRLALDGIASVIVDSEDVVPEILKVIHLPGLRGTPERVYPKSAVRTAFPGTFDNYTASVIGAWSDDRQAKLNDLADDLNLLGLTWKVAAMRTPDDQLELRVGRMPRPGVSSDLVSIADVGFGVSQALPVVVALRTAIPGQLIYIEQPELHLHPRAQVTMAQLLVNAANRGVLVVAETHSSLLLLAVQTLVAEGKISAEHVGLNWFQLSTKNGSTTIRSADLDAAGRFGDWPEDFDEVSLQAENRYLSAAEDRLSNKR